MQPQVTHTKAGLQSLSPSTFSMPSITSQSSKQTSQEESFIEHLLGVMLFGKFKGLQNLLFIFREHSLIWQERCTESICQEWNQEAGALVMVRDGEILNPGLNTETGEKLETGLF